MQDAWNHAARSAQRMSAQTATAAWVVLVILTIAGWLLARSDRDHAAVAAVVVIAAIKVYLILAVFMGMWQAPRTWHASGIAWVVATFAMIGLIAVWSGA